MKVEIKSNVYEVLLGMRQLAENAKFATVVALTQTAQEIVKAEQQEMESVFKKTSKYTLNSLRLRPATKEKMSARVYVKDDAVKYLTPNIDGGQRPYKGMENALIKTGRMPPGTNAVPAGGKQVTAGEVMKLLSSLMAAEMTSGYSANRTAQSKKRRGAKLVDYISLAQPWGRLKPGIYKRTGNHQLAAVFFYVKRAQYKRLFNFYGVAQSIAEDKFPQLHAAAMRKYIDR